MIYMENQNFKFELKAITKKDETYKVYKVYENTTISKAYAMALEDVKSYPKIQDWYLNF
jgi:hypothetical protein